MQTYWEGEGGGGQIECGIQKLSILGLSFKIIFFRLNDCAVEVIMVIIIINDCFSVS